VIKDYNNNFNIIVDNDETVVCSIPEGNINAYTIRDYINNHESLQNHIKVVYDNLKNMLNSRKKDIIIYNYKLLMPIHYWGFQKLKN
jgi:hypothetical protein